MPRFLFNFRRSLPPSRLARLNRYWRAFFFGLCAIAVVGGVIVIVAPELAGLFLLALYAIPTNSVLPLPHEPGVLYFARFYDPLWIAIAATAASVVVSFADYAIVGAALRRPSLNAAQSSRLFRWAVRWMQRWPFPIVVLFSLTPLPITVIRVLAPASGYPIGRYVVAQIVGRLPRFYALAWLGQAIHFPGWALLAMFFALLLVFWLSGRSNDEQVGIEDAPPAEVIELDPPTHSAV